jgi:hypothetical protein
MRFLQRSNQGLLRAGTPETTEDIEVKALKKGEGAHIHSARHELTGDKLVENPVEAKANSNGGLYRY